MRVEELIVSRLSPESLATKEHYDNLHGKPRKNYRRRSAGFDSFITEKAKIHEEMKLADVTVYNPDGIINCFYCDASRQVTDCKHRKREPLFRADYFDATVCYFDSWTYRVIMYDGYWIRNITPKKQPLSPKSHAKNAALEFKWRNEEMPASSELDQIITSAVPLELRREALWKIGRLKKDLYELVLKGRYGTGHDFYRRAEVIRNHPDDEMIPELEFGLDKRQVWNLYCLAHIEKVKRLHGHK